MRAAVIQGKKPVTRALALEYTGDMEMANLRYNGLVMYKHLRHTGFIPSKGAQEVLLFPE